MARIAEDQSRYDLAVVETLVGCTPDHWEEILLDVQREVGVDEERHHITIGSPEGFRESVVASQELVNAIGELGDFFDRTDMEWASMHFELWIDEHGEWTYEAEFEHID